jgi:hypothetical protein
MKLDGRGSLAQVVGGQGALCQPEWQRGSLQTWQAAELRQRESLGTEERGRFQPQEPRGYPGPWMDSRDLIRRGFGQIGRKLKAKGPVHKRRFSEKDGPLSLYNWKLRESSGQG